MSLLLANHCHRPRAAWGSRWLLYNSWPHVTLALLWDIANTIAIPRPHLNHNASQDIPAMKEGGKRLVVAPPGPLQRQGTKSLVWMVGMLDALEEAGGRSRDQG
jgi:hypothetical protein